MQLKELNQYLYYLERTYNLFELKLDRWSIWPTIRLPLTHQLQEIGDLVSGFSYLTYQDRLGLLFEDLFKLRKLHSSKYLFWLNCQALRDTVGQKYKDVIIDDFVSSLQSHNYQKIDLIYNSSFLNQRKNALNPGVMSSTLFEVATPLVPLSKSTKTKIEELVNIFESCYLKESKFLPPNKVFKLLTRYAKRKKLYTTLLERINPEFLIKTVAGDYDLVAAAKEKNVKVIEMQHGSPNCSKVAYSWSKSAVKHKGILPLPDQVFLFGDFFVEELKENNFWDEELVSVGSFRMDEWRNRFKKDGKSTQNQGAPITLTLTSQGIDIEGMVQFLTDFLALAKKKKRKIIINIKLHPVWEKNPSHYTNLKEQFGQNVNLYVANEDPSTYYLIANSDLHLSIFSTTHYEALALGTPTVILPFQNHQQILDKLIDRPYVWLADTPQSLLEIIDQAQLISIPRSDSEYFFRYDTLGNMHLALEK